MPYLYLDKMTTWYSASSMLLLPVFISCWVGYISAAGLCTKENKELVARIVFGEARGETYAGQLAVAYTIVNRINHPGYPNTIDGVIFQRYGKGKSSKNQYFTVYTAAWKQAKEDRDATYSNAMKAATGALCGREPNPVTTACHPTDFCAYDPCSATKSNNFWAATHKTRIGNHWFVCREKI